MCKPRGHGSRPVAPIALHSAVSVRPVASVPSEPRPVLGRLDRGGRLVSADPQLEALQREAGSSLGQPLALPQVAAVAQLARKLRTPVSRPAVAASTDHDIELWVQATPEGDEIALSLEGWTVRAPAGPRLASILGGNGETAAAASRNEWTTDEELRIISLSADFAELLGVDVADASGAALTRIVRLEEDEPAAPARSSAFDHALEEVLRSPLDRIIESAERIVDRSDGPLRSDYASYGTDIAAAARHLLSVLRAMSEDPAQGNQTVDLAALTG